jgi:DNA-binding MarR family transcriptional regulator
MTETSCICIAVRQAGRKLTAFYDDALAPTGINVAQFSLLRKLRRHGPLSLTTLGEQVELDRSTLGRNLRVLQKMDLCHLAAGRDQRESVASLTQLGHDCLTAGDPLWEGAQAAVAEKLGANGADTLRALLGALGRNV